MTEGFSGAELVMLCQHAAMAAIRDAVAKRELNANWDDDDDRCEICRHHFEDAFGTSCVGCYASQDAKYETFRRKFEPRCSAAPLVRMNWPRDPVWPCVVNMPDVLVTCCLQEAAEGGVTAVQCFTLA